MATANIATPASVLQFPQSASVDAPQKISQLELAALLSLRARLHQIESQVASAEESIKARLAAGAEIEAGDHAAQLKENFRRNVSWKEVAQRLAIRLKLNPDQYCQRVLSATKPTRTVSLDIA